jgi:hypothetical protein
VKPLALAIILVASAALAIAVIGSHRASAQSASTARANDFLNSMGFNYENNNTNTPATSIESRAVLALLPQLHVTHLRVSSDVPNDVSTQNTLAPYRVDADALTSNSTTVSGLKSFCASLVTGCSSYELANEPNASGVDANWANDLPKQAAAWNVAMPATLPTLPIYGPSYTVISAIQTAEPVSFLAAVPPVPVIGNSISAYNIHPYVPGFSPEQTGYGGFFSSGCGPGPAFSLACGSYGSLAWAMNTGETIGWGLPGVATEGVASYGSYPSICGSGQVDLITQQAYVQDGFLFAFTSGLLRSFAYKLVDDGTCSDGFGAHGIINRIQDTSGATLSLNPKPAFTALAFFNELLFDSGPTSYSFSPQLLNYTVTAPADVSNLPLAESDGSYRIILWSTSDLWSPNAASSANCKNGAAVCGTRNSLVSDSATVTLPGSATVETFTQDTTGFGAWKLAATNTAVTSVTTTVNQYPLVLDIIPTTSSATPLPLPTGIATPGTPETPAPSTTSLPIAGPTTVPAPLPSVVSIPTNDPSAPSVAQSPAFFASSGNSPALTLALGSAPSVGDVLWAQMTYDLNADATRAVIPPDNTWTTLDSPTHSINNNDVTTETFYHKVTGSESGAYTFYQTSPLGVLHPVTGILMDIANADPSTFVGPHKLASGFNSTFFLPAGIRPAVAHSLAIGFAGANGGSGVGGQSITPGAATGAWYVNAFAYGVGNSSIVAYNQNSGLGSDVSTTITVPNNQPYVSGIDIIQPIGASAIAPTPIPTPYPTPPPVDTPPPPGSTNTIALVQPCAVAQNSSSILGLTAVLLNPTAIGSRVVAGYSAVNATGQTLFAPSGFTNYGSGLSAGAVLLGTWGFTTISATQSFTFAQSVASSSSLIVCEFSNVASISASTGSTTGLTLTTASVTPTLLNSLPVSFFAFDHYPSLRLSAGWNSLKYVGSPYRSSLQAQIDQSVKTLTPISASVTTVSSSAIAGTLLVLTPTQSATPPPPPPTATPSPTPPPPPPTVRPIADTRAITSDSAQLIDTPTSGFRPTIWSAPLPCPQSGGCAAGVLPIPQTLPGAPQITIEAVVKCNYSAVGGDVIAYITAWTLKAGTCQPVANVGNSTSSGFYDATAVKQVFPPLGLAPATTYFIAGSADGANINWYQCVFPVVSCIKTSLASTGALATASSALIGSSNGPVRVFQGDIWGMREIASAESDAQVLFDAQHAVPDPYTSPSTAPTSTPPPPSALCATSYPSGTYPTFSACFTGNTPYHHRIDTLKAAGFAFVDTSVATSTWWSQTHSGYSGIAGGSGGVGPLYFYVSGQTGRTVTCDYTNGVPNGNGCGHTMYLPSGASPEVGSDHHLSYIDMVNQVEVDGWGSGNGCAIGGSTITCSAAAYYAFNGNGVVGGAWGGDAGGVAFGLADDSAAEILSFVHNGTHIAHVGGIEAACLSTTARKSDGVYPDAGKSAEIGCGSYHGPVYGEFIHIKSSVSITSLTSDPYCQAVLYQGQEYGWETMDIAGGFYLNFEDPKAYNVSPWSTNPWTGISNSSTFNSTNGCVNDVPSGDVETVQLTGSLPTQYPYGDSRN